MFNQSREPEKKDLWNLTTVMYHYVRPLQGSQYPAIKGLELSDFVAQLRFLKRHYCLISMAQLIGHFSSGESLPKGACLLTFDDGYSDHYKYAYQALKNENIKGTFFAPRSSVIDHRILEVNKIQFVMASVTDYSALELELDSYILEMHPTQGQNVLQSLKQQHRQPNRFDPAEVIYVKRLLQHALPELTRKAITAKLFSKYVTRDETDFAQNLYLSLTQAREMQAAGMHFGGHGDQHLWHSKLSHTQLSDEIAGADELLKLIGVADDQKTYCYPYGDYSIEAERLLEKSGYRTAFTVRPALTNTISDSAFALPRLDTNDLPKLADAAPNAWTINGSAA
jgi:peptidoglycan/xylan/chitin deacetylase (PgdA/CDA1 family)